MRVLVDEAAWRDIDGIGRWIARDNPTAAHLQVEKIEHAIAQLGNFPGLSRPGRARGTFESIVAGARVWLRYSD